MKSLENRSDAVIYRALHGELVRAELAGEISEFQALCFQAVLAIAEGSEFANDYLEMAEAVASSPDELAIVAESRAGIIADTLRRCAESALEYIEPFEGSLYCH